MIDIVERLREALAERYAVEDLIGEGGMARVYRATDLKHKRTVAIKVLRPELGAALGPERFLSEIQICAGLSHPHILPLYDSGAAGDLLYYVMPFVEGESLRSRLDRARQLSVEDALHVARGVAAALAYAHSRGIVHRDIKPENILLCADEPIVADFGIAKAITAAEQQNSRNTSEGIAVGTPAYMSPEQGSGDANIDGRSDIYSLGCVLFEMLIGEPPFTGPTAMAITAQKLTEPAPRAGQLRDTVPPGLDSLIVKSLARMPADRFNTAWDLTQALSGGLSATMAVTGQAPAVEPPPRSIAVLPFTNMGGAADDEFFSDGLTEELIHLLGTVEGLHVVARTSAFAFKGTKDDVRSIGRKLNIGAVLEGSVRRSGNRLRVTTQLVKTNDGYQLWSERFDRTLDDVFAVQDEIARATVDALKMTLLGKKRPSVGGAAPVRNVEAYELYLRGRHAWNLRTEEGLHSSVSLLRRAIELDATDELAHAALADSYTTLGIYSALRADEVMPLAEQAAEQALSLKPELAEALATLGCIKSVYRWSWSEAEALFKRAIAARPGYPTAHQWYAINCLTPQKRYDEARAALGQALKYDPLNPAIRISLGLVEHFAGDHGAAIEVFRRAMETDPGFGMARYFLGRTYEALGRQADAIAAYRRAGELSGPSPEITASLAHAHARMDRREEAEALFAELEAKAKERYVSPVLIALVSLSLGNRGRALDELEKACDERATQLIWLPVRPAFDSLRGEPRFKAVLDRLGLS